MSGDMLLYLALGSLGLAIGLAVVAVAPRKARPSGVGAALATIEQRYSRRGERQQDADPFAILPSWSRAIALRLSPGNMTASLQHRLDISGNPGPWTPDRLLGAKGLGLVVFGLLGTLLGLHSLTLLVVGLGIGGAVGFYLPDLLLYNSGQKRQTAIRNAMPDALDMLTICVEAGLGFDAALAQVARNTRGPLAAEFARALQEMQIGQSRAQALRGMVARTTVPELRAFVSSLVQAGELGISIANVLREQASEMRVRRRQRAEERAQKMPIKILFPVIFCMLPSLFVVILGPGAITIFGTLFGAGGVFGGK